MEKGEGEEEKKRRARGEGTQWEAYLVGSSLGGRSERR